MAAKASKKKSDLKLIPYDPLPARNVSRTLRQIAENVDQNVYGELDNIMILLHPHKGPITPFLLGLHANDPTWAMGLLSRGLGAIQRLAGIDWQQ